MNNISLYILDIVQNSIKSHSSVVDVTIDINEDNGLLLIEILDDGDGMNEDALKKVFDPFYTTRDNRDVGLGLPLFKELCEICNGRLEIESEIGVGTKVQCQLDLNSLDLPPLGDLTDLVLTIILNDEDVELVFKYKKNNKHLIISTYEIKSKLENVSIQNPIVISWLKEFIKENFNSL